MNVRQSRFAKLGKAVLSNPNFDLRGVIANGSEIFSKVDRLKELSDEFDREDQKVREIKSLKQQVLSQKFENEKMRKLIEHQLQQTQRNIIQTNKDMVKDIKLQFEELKGRQAIIEESIKRPPYYIPPQAYWPPRQNFQQPVQQPTSERYLPSQKSEKPTKKILRRGYNSGPMKGIYQQPQNDPLQSPRNQQPEDQPARMPKASRSAVPSLKSLKQPYSSEKNYPIIPKQSSVKAPQKTVYSRKSVKPPSEAQVAPTEVPAAQAEPQKRPRPTTRKIRKYLLAVYYMTSIKKQIRSKIARRKLKSQTYFNDIYGNVMRFIGDSFRGLLGDVEKKIMTFQTKPPEYKESNECYKQVKELMKEVVGVLPKAKDILMKDKTSLNLMKLLLRQNEFIPSGYLTPYELTKVQFSPSFGFLYKTQPMKSFLLSTFLLMRCLILQTFCQPLAFNIVFEKNEVVGAMLKDLTDGFYQISKQITEQYRTEITEKGNWNDLPMNLAYAPAPAATIEIQEFCKGFDDQLADYLRSDTETWGSLQFRIKEWVEDIRSAIDEHSKSELSFYKTAKSKRITNGALKKTIT